MSYLKDTSHEYATSRLIREWTVLSDREAIRALFYLALISLVEVSYGDPDQQLGQLVPNKPASLIASASSLGEEKSRAVSENPNLATIVRDHAPPSRAYGLCRLGQAFAIPTFERPVRPQVRENELPVATGAPDTGSSFTRVPEPAGLGAMAVACVALMGWRRKRLI